MPCPTSYLSVLAIRCMIQSPDVFFCNAQHLQVLVRTRYMIQSLDMFFYKMIRLS